MNISSSYPSKLLVLSTLFCFLYSCCLAKDITCADLKLGQYRCDDPVIDAETQHIAGCTFDEYTNKHTAEIRCYPAPQIVCNNVTFDGASNGFNKTIECEPRHQHFLMLVKETAYEHPQSEKSFRTALLLSIFLGMFGIDRFYLGYPALGLLKLSTFGFMLVGQLIDIILIATQVVQPADGGNYIVDYYGPRLVRLYNTTYDGG